MSPRVLAAGIVGVAAVLRLTHVLTIGDYPLFDVLPLDSESYDAWARRIAAGEWLRDRPFYQAPLYAYFLAMLHAASGGDLLLPRLVNALLGTGTVALAIRLGGRTFGTTAGLAAGALCALHGTFLFEEGKVMKTSLGVFLAATTLLLLVEARRDERGRPGLWGAAGLAGGAAALVRENFVLFLAAAVVWAMLRVGRRPAVLFALGAAIAIVPATLHNFLVSGEPHLITSQAGQNLYTGLHPGNPHGGYEVPDFVRRSPRFEEIDFAAEAERRSGRALGAGAVSRFWLRESMRVAADDPSRVVGLFLTKLGLLYHRHEIPDDEDVRFLRRWAPVLRLPLVGFGAVAVLGLVGMGLAVRRREAPGELVLFVVIYSVSVAMFFVFSRYRLPLVVPLSAFAGYALFRAAETIRARRWGALAPPVIAAIPLAAVVARPLDLAIGLENSHLSVGIAHEVKGEPDDALREYRAGLELAPDHPKLLRRAASLAFDCDAAGDRIDPATLDLLERAVRAQPDDPELRGRLAVAAFASGRPDRAAAEFRRILSDGHELPGLHANLALALEAAGRPDEARREAETALRLDPGDAAARGVLGRLGAR